MRHRRRPKEASNYSETPYNSNLPPTRLISQDRDNYDTDMELGTAKSAQLKNLKMIVNRRKRYDSLMKGSQTSKVADYLAPSYEQIKPLPNCWLKKHGTGPGFT